MSFSPSAVSLSPPLLPSFSTPTHKRLLYQLKSPANTYTDSCRIYFSEYSQARILEWFCWHAVLAAALFLFVRALPDWVTWSLLNCSPLAAYNPYLCSCETSLGGSGCAVGAWRSRYGFIGTGLPTGAHLEFLIVPSQSVSGAIVAWIKSKSFHVDKMYLEAQDWRGKASV